MKNLLIIISILALLACGSVALADHGGYRGGGDHGYRGGYHGGYSYGYGVYVAPAPVYVAPAPVYVDPQIVQPDPYYYGTPYYYAPYRTAPQGGVILGGRGWGVRLGW